MIDRSQLREEFREHAPYTVETDRTFRSEYYRFVCPCGETGEWVSGDVELAHDAHRRHVAATTRRCPKCMEPLTLRITEREGDDVDVALVCGSCGVPR